MYCGLVPTRPDRMWRPYGDAGSIVFRTTHELFAESINTLLERVAPSAQEVLEADAGTAGQAQERLGQQISQEADRLAEYWRGRKEVLYQLLDERHRNHFSQQMSDDLWMHLVEELVEFVMQPPELEEWMQATE